MISNGRETNKEEALPVWGNSWCGWGWLLDLDGCSGYFFILFLMERTSKRGLHRSCSHVMERKKRLIYDMCVLQKRTWVSHFYVDDTSRNNGEWCFVSQSQDGRCNLRTKFCLPRHPGVIS